MNSEKKVKILLAIYLMVLFLSVFYFAFSSFKYKILYDEAIKQGAEGIVTSLEMLSVCMEKGNFTQEDIFNGYVERFILKQEESK